jgi:serine/threonine-protein kinase RsbW
MSEASRPAPAIAPAERAPSEAAPGLPDKIFADGRADSPEGRRPALHDQSPRSPFGNRQAQREEAPVTVTIPAHSEYVRVVRLAVTGVASRMKFSFEQVEDIKLAVSEACNNAILHAVPAQAGVQSAFVSVQMVSRPDRLEITVADQGHVPPPGLSLAPRASAPAASLEDLPEGGLGLLLIQSLMDEVAQHSGDPEHTLLHMVKRLSLA